MSKYWIFDYDGVLGDTIPTILKFKMWHHGVTYKQALQLTDEYAARPRHCKRTITSESYSLAKNWNTAFHTYLQEVHPPLFDNFIDILVQLKDLKCAVVTNNSINSINPKLHNLPITFDKVLGFEHGHSKEDRIVEIIKYWGVDTHRVKFLTDTNSDVLEVMHTLPLYNIFCCTWGWNDFNRASLHLPANNILREFHDIEWA